MKPNFALSLSFDGIRLMHRASGGWRLVGEVGVASDELASELAVLRKTASDLQPGRLRSKLIIPDDQIRYLSIATGPLDHDNRIEAARAALNGATPYPVDALSFDISEDGETTHIAAVARETLAEAEGFATEHRFHPISFVAAPVDKPFLGEPFFGPSAYASTLLAEGETVEADGVRVVVIGKVEIPDGPVAADDVHASLPVSDRTHDVTGNSAKDTASEIAQVAPLAAPFKSNGPDAVDVEVAATGSDAQGLILDRAAHSEQGEAKISDGRPTPDPEKGTGDPPPALGFASRRGPAKGQSVRRLGGVTRTSPLKAAESEAPPAPPSLEAPKAAAESLDPASGPEITIPRAPETPRTEDVVKDGTVGFLSRRKLRTDDAGFPLLLDPPVGSFSDAAAAQQTVPLEAKTQDSSKGKPRYLSLILTLILIVCLAGVAAWASGFLDDRLSWLFPGRERTLASTLPNDINGDLANDVGVTTRLPTPEPEPENSVDLASLNDDLSVGLSAEDSAVLDALRDPEPEREPVSVSPQKLDQATQEARYAVTGVWTVPPVTPDAPEMISLQDLYVTGIDPVSPALDAVAMPNTSTFQTDKQLAIVTSPAEPGISFARDAAGRVLPTVEGALSPDGFTVFLGRPPIVPPQTPLRNETVPTAQTELRSRTLVRPKSRPTNLVESHERARLGGLSRSELGLLRPRLRPASAQELAAAAAKKSDAAPSSLAIEISMRTRTRPADFERIVARAQRKQNRSATAPAASSVTASVAPKTVKPNIPSSTSVTREATMKNAINLRRVNLIGVYGSPSSRRALVRLGNGRYQKVQVGDRFDGGRVSAIGDSELRYQKGGRNVVLKIPKG